LSFASLKTQADWLTKTSNNAYIIDPGGSSVPLLEKPELHESLADARRGAEKDGFEAKLTGCPCVRRVVIDERDLGMTCPI